MRKIQIYDTTLRDGIQSKGIRLTVAEKIKIAKLLDELGVAYIEGGWPGSNPKDMTFFKQMQKIHLKNAKLVAFGSTRRANRVASSDSNIKAIIKSKVSVATIFGKSWSLHVKHVLKTSLENNLKMISDSIRYLKKHDLEVIYDAEHFFDGFKENPAYALETLEAAKNAGASTIVLCDTNGGSLPSEIIEIVTKVKKEVGGALGIHTHNDGDMAVANTIVAVQHGVEHVQGTINGIGERCGNANLCSIIPTLQLKMDCSCITTKQLKRITYLSHVFDIITDSRPNAKMPYVGQDAFAHKAGVHVDAIQKKTITYEHIDPASVGNRRNIVISELSGASNIINQLKKYGLVFDKTDPKIKALLQEIKVKEDQGYAFEEGAASFDLLVFHLINNVDRMFTIENFRLQKEWTYGTNQKKVLIEIAIKDEGCNKIFYSSATDESIIEAMIESIIKALEKPHPVLTPIRIFDYKIRVLESLGNAKSRVRAIVTAIDDKDNIWTTIGVGDNVFNAILQACIEVAEYKILESLGSFIES